MAENQFSQDTIRRQGGVLVPDSAHDDSCFSSSFSPWHCLMASSGKQLPLHIPPKVFLLCSYAFVNLTIEITVWRVCETTCWWHCEHGAYPKDVGKNMAYGEQSLDITLPVAEDEDDSQSDAAALDGNSVALFSWLALMRDLWRIFWLETRSNVGNACLSFKKENSPSLGWVCVWHVCRDVELPFLQLIPQILECLVAPCCRPTSLWLLCSEQQEEFYAWLDLVVAEIDHVY